MSLHKKRRLGVYKQRICHVEASKREVRQVVDVAEAICWTLTDTPPHLSWLLRLSGAVKDDQRLWEGKEGAKCGRRWRRVVGWELDGQLRAESYLEVTLGVRWKIILLLLHWGGVTVALLWTRSIIDFTWRRQDSKRQNPIPGFCKGIIKHFVK